MPQPRNLPPEGIPEAPRIGESPGSAIRPDVQNQLTNVKDISAAHNFFKPSGAESFLPNVQTGPSGISGMKGLELSFAKPMAPVPTGFESSIAGAHGALGMPLPGAEQVSPLINMIMKLPGHIGLASSFFEMLGNFFLPGAGGGDMLGMLDPSLLEGGSEVFAQAFEGMESVGEHMSADLSLLDGNAPIFETLSPTELADAGLSSGGADLASVGDMNHSIFDGAMNSHLEVGGGMSPGKGMFEQQPEVIVPNYGQGSELLAMDPGGGFNSTIGPASTGSSLPAPTNFTQQMPPSTPAAADGQQLHYGDGSAQNQFGHGSQMRDKLLDTGHQPGDQANGQMEGNSDMTAGDSQIAETQPYTVQSGDNLWDIARKHLGDGTRWGEIYKLNEGIIGDNPRLIMPGAELKLPGDANLAMSGDYTVQPGDNLWNISKDHLGGGQNWHELYSENAQTIGSNPDLIHPGQHFHMSGHGDSLAHSGAGSNLAHSGAAATSHQHLASNTTSGAHPASTHASGGSSHHHSGHSDHSSGHHAGSNAGQPEHGPEVKSSQPQSAPVELKAQAGSLGGLSPQMDGSIDSSSYVPSR